MHVSHIAAPLCRRRSCAAQVARFVPTVIVSRLLEAARQNIGDCRCLNCEQLGHGAVGYSWPTSVACQNAPHRSPASGDRTFDV